MQTVQEISNKLGADITENLNFLNYVSICRKENLLSNFENIGHILLTGNALTLKVAFHEKIKPEGAVPLATSLNWITDKFWFKLNKGFGNGNFPASFDVIVKAQIVLSSILNKSIGEKYDELQEKFKQGEITEEIAKSRVIELRFQVRKPEDIGLDDVSTILDVLSEDSLEKFAKEHEFAKNEALKQSQENVKLRKELARKEEALAKEEADRIKAQGELIRTYEKNLIDKKGTIEKLEDNKSRIDKLALKDFNNFKIRWGIGIAILFIIPIIVTSMLGIDLIAIITWLIPLAFFVYSLITGKEWIWKPALFLETKKEQYKKKKYLDFKFDIDYLNKLKDETKLLEDEIAKINLE